MKIFVSREEAIESLYQALGDESGCDTWRRIRNAINKVEAADVRPNVKGKWIIEYDPGTGWYRVTCSECGENVTSQIPMIGFFPKAKALWDYCPSCGSDNRPTTSSTDMRGEE